MTIQTINVGAAPNDGTGDKNRNAFIKVNANFTDVQTQINNTAGLNLVAGPVTKLAPGANPTASLTGTAPNLTLNLGLPEGVAGAGAPTSADILALAERDDLLRGIAAAGVPESPSLILDFVRGVQFAKGGFVGASVVSMIAAIAGSSFARASTATYFDSDGLMKTAASGVPRIAYDPVSRLRRGLRVEAARTNLLTYSEQLGDVSWAKGAVTVTDNAATAPDGLTTADKVVETITTSSHNLNKSVTVVSATAYTCSIFVKVAERSSARLYFDDGAGTVHAGAIFDLVSEAITGITGTGATARMDFVGNGWVRLQVSGTTTSTTGRFVFYLNDAAGSWTYTGDGSSGIYVWGAQVEAGVAASSYIPTVASSVVRAADALLFGTSPWVNPASPGTYLAEAVFDSPAGPTDRLMEISDSTNNNRILLQRTLSGAGSAAVIASGATSSNPALGAVTIGQPYRIVAAMADNDMAFSSDGAAVVTDTSGAIPIGLTQMRVGYGLTALQTNGYVRRILYYPQRLSNAKLALLSNQALWS